MNIVLMGYMGCGKSAVGKGLAAQLGTSFIDLDAYIETQEKKSISTIFKEKGEIYFRKQESSYLKELLSEQSNAVISLGGGTPCFTGNLDSIQQHPETLSIYLQTSLETLSSRLFTEKEQRPLLAHIKTEEALQDFIRKHLFERSYYYNQATYKVVTDHRSITEVVQAIQQHLKL